MNSQLRVPSALAKPSLQLNIILNAVFYGPKDAGMALFKPFFDLGPLI